MGGGGHPDPPGPFPWIRHWLWVQYNENSSNGMSKIHQRSEGTLTDAKNIQEKDIASFSKVRLKQILPNYTFRRNNNNT